MLFFARMFLHLSALLVIQVTASQHGPRGVTSLPELGHCNTGVKKDRPILHFIAPQNNFLRLTHPLN
jgi:hypothetical protein